MNNKKIAAFMLALFVLTCTQSCSVRRKNRCNTCPQFNSI